MYVLAKVRTEYVFFNATMSKKANENEDDVHSEFLKISTHCVSSTHTNPRDIHMEGQNRRCKYVNDGRMLRKEVARLLRYDGATPREILGRFPKPRNHSSVRQSVYRGWLVGSFWLAGRRVWLCSEAR